MNFEVNHRDTYFVVHSPGLKLKLFHYTRLYRRCIGGSVVFISELGCSDGHVIELLVTHWSNGVGLVMAALGTCGKEIHTTILPVIRSVHCNNCVDVVVIYLCEKMQR